MDDICKVRELEDFDAALDEFLKIEFGRLVIYTDDSSRLIGFDRHENVNNLINTMNYATNYLSEQTKTKIFKVIQVLKIELRNEYTESINLLDTI
jgi:hypothetical protein